MSKKNIQKRYLGPDPEPTPPQPKLIPEAEVQAQIDTVVKKRLAEEKKKFDVERAEHLSRIAKLEPDAQKAAELQAQIEEIERKGKTAAELAQMDLKKERAAAEEKTKKALEDAEKWRKKHEQSQLDRDLMDAASSKEADAANPAQMVTLLKDKARIVPKAGTDDLEVRIRMIGTKDGKPMELDLSPAEAIKIMKEDKSNFNLFNAGIKGGLGGTQTQVRAGVSANSKLSLSQEEFNKKYAKGALPKADR